MMNYIVLKILKGIIDGYTAQLKSMWKHTTAKKAIVIRSCRW